MCVHAHARARAHAYAHARCTCTCTCTCICTCTREAEGSPVPVATSFQRPRPPNPHTIRRPHLQWQPAPMRDPPPPTLKLHRMHGMLRVAHHLHSNWDSVLGEPDLRFGAVQALAHAAPSQRGWSATLPTRTVSSRRKTCPRTTYIPPPFSPAEVAVMDSKWEFEHPGGKFEVELRADAFNHFDVNHDGLIEAERCPQFLRYLFPQGALDIDLQ